MTNTFSEKSRHYMNTYLEICEVYDEAVEVSVFSSESQPYEIYVSYGRMYGIIYSNAEDAYVKLEEIKKYWRKNTKKIKNLRLNLLKLLLKNINWNCLRTYFLMHRHYLICFDSVQKQKQCGRRIFAQGYFKADRCERI